ncbi:MAG: PAS domain-containing protein [Pseudomonadota bacterium]|nr:PAS domain-containing protein [Pseudomonadota bacterium]
MPIEALPGLDLLATPVILVDPDGTVRYINSAAESLFTLSRRTALDHPLGMLIPGLARLLPAIQAAWREDLGFIEHEVSMRQQDGPAVLLNCVGTPLHGAQTGVLLELRPIDQQLRIAREERLLHDQRINRELIRNLAHEIRNPLGGIRGAAQLLERELQQASLKEYTQVIRKEADRLQVLMDRLLSPNRIPQNLPVNIHEVLERVRSLILAEFPDGIRIVRDYDTSLPDLQGDREQLIQAVLNIVRNAAQALEGRGEIRLRSRAARQVTLVRRRYRLALLVQIIDNGPGIPEALQARVFQPLVSGREGGSGLGLMLAQNFINQHHGLVECESQPGHTCFSLLLPVPGTELSAGNS